MEYRWIRTCQECGHRQVSKPISLYKTDSWRETRCDRCGSPGALDYGSEQLVDHNNKRVEEATDE